MTISTIFNYINTTISQAGANFIKSFEGFAAYIYICLGGYKSIGYGHALRVGEIFKEPMNKIEGDVLIKKDIRVYEYAVTRYIKVPLSQGQRDALISFTFNLGAGALQRSTLRMKLNRGEYESAADEFPRWCRAGGRIVKGLLRRRRAEREIFLHG